MDLAGFISEWKHSAFANLSLDPPWLITSHLTEIVRSVVLGVSDDFSVDGDVAIHHTAVIEQGANIKGPAIISSGVFISAGALLRGGIFLGEGCIIGHACEAKTTVMFPRSKIAHLSFVGDSILGENVNIEAGAIVANHRNELSDKSIRIRADNEVIDTGVDKFGALIGDHVKIGANAVVAPGALLQPDLVVPRLGHIDQHPDATISQGI